MKREREEEMRTQKGSVNIGFFDLNNMSTQASLLYVGGLVCFFGIIFYILVNKLLNKPVDFSKKKRVEREQKKSSKTLSGKKNK